MKKHNKIFLGMALAAAMLPMAACTDDVPQTVRLEVATETAGAKMTLGSDRYTYFEEGDIVKINNQSYALASDGSGGYHWADVQFPQDGNSYTAFFPASLQARDLQSFNGTVSGNYINRTVRVIFPRKYDYNPASPDKINIPMVAFEKLSSTRLKFYHVGAVIGLTIDNQATGQMGNIGQVKIDSVRFTISNDGNGTAGDLSGEFAVEFRNGSLYNVISQAWVESSLYPGRKNVSVHLNPNNNIVSNVPMTIPVPTPRVKKDATLTLTLYGKNRLTTAQTSNWSSFTYSADYTLTQAIARNQYVSATATLTGEGMNFFMFIDNGIESHDNNGNLW